MCTPSLYIEKTNTFPGPDSSVLLYSSQRSLGLHCKSTQDVCLSGRNNVPDITNPTMLKDAFIEEVESWFASDEVENPKTFVWDKLQKKWIVATDPFLKNLRHYNIFSIDSLRAVRILCDRSLYEWKKLSPL
ncbi:kelch-like protein 28 [Trichonephila clavipes]|nr:kelch-like protein 28 [Trichonephila clavipes]